MSRPIRVAITSIAPLTLLAACSGPPSPTNDAGVDAEIIFELPDSGPLPPDAPEPPDAGDGTCADLSMLPFGTPALPPECLPRCTAETRDAVAACGDDAVCVQAAIDADDSPPITFHTRYGIYSVSCRAMRNYACAIWQTWSCYEEWCRGEFYAYAGCLDGGGTCETELGTIQACMDAVPDAVRCLEERNRACYP